jgi:putative copper export protein/mono/diheme cytochrome c family protein
MLYMFFDTVELLGLFLLMGGPIFFGIIWRAVYADDDAISVLMHKRILICMLIGAGLFIVASLLSIVSGSGQHSAIFDPTDTQTFSASYQYEFTLIGLLLVPAYIALFHRKVIHSNRFYHIGMTVLALVILWTISITTHTDKEQGLLPLGSNLLHLAITVIWGGGLLSLMVAPWQMHSQFSGQDGTRFWQVVNRFTNLTILTLVFTLMTGSLLTFVHVHSDAAMDSTQYGQALKLKIFVVSLLVVMMLLNLLKFIPALKRGLQGSDFQVTTKLLKRYKIFVSIQAFIIAVILVISGAMTTHVPPDTAPFLNPQSWIMSVDDLPIQVEMRPVAGSVNNVRFEIYLPDTLNFTNGSWMTFSLYMPVSNIGSFENEAIQASSNSYLGEGVFAMPGDWRFEIEFWHAGNELLKGTHDFVVQEQPLREDIKAYLSIHAIGYTIENTVNFIVGVLLIVTFCWLIWQSRTGSAPDWVAVAGMGGLAVGFYMISSVMLVKTYPSTFWKNPEEYSARIIMQGQEDYIAQCAECHGATGKGDGPWALEQQRQVLDLASPHLDVHTDGEIFWWVTYGIPTLDMPPLEDKLSEQQRWRVIHYIRSIRHGIPEE